MKSNSKWVVYIYVIFLITILLTIMAFISKYVFWNLDIYYSIKNYFTMYWTELWVNEELLVNYYDNPRNLQYVDSKYYDKNKFISRYNDFIESSLDEGDMYELNLTTNDEEYNNKLNSLKYLDIYWNTNENKCNINISMIRWDKNNISSIINNKKELKSDENNVILYSFWKDNEIHVSFSTWAFYNWTSLNKDNFLFNNWSITSLSWSLKKYDLTIDTTLNFDLINVLNIKDWQVKDINWNFFDSDNIVIKNENWNIYNNRYRITDSFWLIDKNKYDYKIIITSSSFCSFYVEWFDNDNKIVKLPTNKLSWELKVRDAIVKDVIISKNINIWNINLSNFLYKFY